MSFGNVNAPAADAGADDGEDDGKDDVEEGAEDGAVAEGTEEAEAEGSDQGIAPDGGSTTVGEHDAAIVTLVDNSNNEVKRLRDMVDSG
ncbi:hypothetical protein [Cupriavidus plantarum]|uniref:hypothetical protein n=1 Tax=Cupriavidus plantarum TaxID=942865 RepID=UPI00339D8AFE